jgi:hypothetical protein
MAPVNSKSVVYAGILVEKTQRGKRLIGNMAAAAVSAATAPGGVNGIRTDAASQRPPPACAPPRGAKRAGSRGA